MSACASRCWRLPPGTPPRRASRRACGRAGSPTTSGRRRSPPTSASSSPRRAVARRVRSTTCCCSGRPASARRRWPTSSPPRWGRALQVTSGPVLERAGDLAAILTNLEPGDVLFVDEIHRLAPTVDEILYPALEDFTLDLVVGQGPAARTMRLTLPPLHAGRRDHARRAAAAAAARPLRHRPPPRLLRARRAGDDRARARPGCSASPWPTTRPRRSRGAPAARRASPTACCGGCATSPTPAARRRSRSRPRASGSSASRSTPSASTSSTAGCWRR